MFLILQQEQFYLIALYPLIGHKALIKISLQINFSQLISPHLDLNQ